MPLFFNTLLLKLLIFLIEAMLILLVFRKKSNTNVLLGIEKKMIFFSINREEKTV